MFAILAGLVALALEWIKKSRADRKQAKSNALVRGLAVRIKLQMMEQTIERSWTQVEIERALRGDESADHVGKIDVIDRTRHQFSLEDLEVFAFANRFGVASVLAELSSCYSCLLDEILAYDELHKKLLEEGVLRDWEDAKINGTMTDLIKKNYLVASLEEIQPRLVFWLRRCDSLIKAKKQEIVNAVSGMAPGLKALPEMNTR